MNLRWPRSVPYRSILGKPTSDSSQPPESPAGSKKTEEAQTAPSKPHASPIYGDTLAPHEFRLACLTAVEGANEQFPLHVSLEVFEDRNCPEYETVSYTWGGEDADYSLSRPIFVGPFWDVLFQTKNCWEMLRFVRPWRGTRMVWVDALCINQANITERGQQVAKMARIYEHCLRVIIYLGSDIILPLSRGTFPTRCRLLDLSSGSVAPKLPAGHKLAAALSLGEILERQYFSRVWVIQELLLSRQTVIRIGDVEFWTDSTPWGTPSEQMPNLESMQAPWVRFLAQKAFATTDILDVLRTTASSRASDPRDKIFGLLSLVRLNDAERRLWQPDYSIPPAHVFTGFFAHCIVNLENLSFLFFAAGIHSAPSSSPSWVPDWSTAESWQQLMTRTPQAAAIMSLQNYTSLPTELWTRQNKYPWDWVYNGGAYQRWNDNIAVCTETGALSLNLTHICEIPTQPIPETPGSGSESSTSTLRYRITGKKQSVYLTSDHPLDRVVQPGHDHIFVLAYEPKPEPETNSRSKPATPMQRLFMKKETPDTSSFYLVLRKTVRPGAFQLVATCSHFLVSSEFDGGGPFRQLGSVHSHLISARRKMEKLIRDVMDISLLFPGAKRGYDLLPMIRAFIPVDVFGDRNLTFASEYLAWLLEQSGPRAAVNPQVVDEHMEMTLPISDHKRYCGDRISIELYDVYAGDRSKLATSGEVFRGIDVRWAYRRYNRWEPITNKDPDILPLLARGEFRLRICIEDVVVALSAWLWDVLAVQRVLQLDYDELVDLLWSLPEAAEQKKLERFHCIGCPSTGTQDAMHDFGLNIYTDRVHIL